MNGNQSEDVIYQDIYSAIIGHKLAPGTKLKEDVLSEIYGVSRARVREVLARLSQNKVVVRILNRGAFVAKPTVEEAKEVFHARHLIEPTLIRALAENSDSKSCDALERQVEKETQARILGDVSEAILEGGNFHTLLAELSGRPIIGEFLKELVNRTALISATMTHSVPADCELNEHRDLIACICEGRADDAVELMNRHLDGIESRLDLSPPRPSKETIQDILGKRHSPATGRNAP